MSKKKWWRVLCVVVILCAFNLALSGCYGEYALFNKVREVNGDVEEKWVITFSTLDKKVKESTFFLKPGIEHLHLEQK